MTMTLGEALIADDRSASFLQDVSIAEGYEKSTEELEKERKSFNRGVRNGALKKAFLKALDIALDDILARAWGGWHELREYADPEKTPPDAINYVSVSDHTVESVYAPSVDFVVHGVVIHSFDFEVAAQLDVQGINLEVQGGKITEIALGDLKLGGSVDLGGRTLLQKDVAQVAIPAVMRLAKPVRILGTGARTNPV